MRRLSALICTAVLMSACSNTESASESEPEQPTETSTDSEPEPEAAGFWSEVPNGDNLRGFIDEDAAAGDCEALQETFNTWDAAEIDSGVKAELLTYIDDALSSAGCYD